MATTVNITGHLYNPLGEVVSQGILHVVLQQDMVLDGQKIAPFEVTVDLSATSGFVDIDIYPTEGASPAGLAYKVEYDPDPADTTRPMRTKDGYWRNFWSVPNTASVPLGSFVSALRGAPSSNYMPLGGTVSSFSDTVTLGDAADINKGVRAPQSSFTPEIRFNASTDQWEFSNDGSVWQNMLQGGGGSVGGNLSGTVGNATVIKIRGIDVSSTAPTTTGQFLRYNAGTTQYEPSLDGSQLTNLNASNLASGTVPLDRLSGITSAQLATTNVIAWTQINFTGSTLASLATRSAADLSSGILPLARLQDIGNAQIAAAAGIDLTKIGDGSVDNTEFGFLNGLDQSLGTTGTPQWARVGFGGAADASAVAKFVGQIFSPLVDNGNSGTAKTIDWNAGNHQKLTLTGNCTLTLNNPKDGARYLLNIFQDGTGGRTITWPADVVWPAGVAPTLTATAGKMDLIVLVFDATTTKYYGSYNLNY